MKKLLLFSSLSLFVLNAFSQTRISVQGGIHSTSVSPFVNKDLKIISSSELKRSSLHFGFIADIPVHDSKKLSFQPGIIYFGRGTTQDLLLDTSTTDIFRATTEQKVNYIDLPMNFVFKFPLKGKTKFILGAGPQASLFYSGSSSYSTIDTLDKFLFKENKDLPVGKGNEQYRVVHFGINALLGLEFKRAYLTANYNKSLSPFYQQTNEYRYSSLGVTLGIFLGKTVTTTKPKLETAIDADRDKDGVLNDLDGCADAAGPLATNGCPDGDSDGIIDTKDNCPNDPGLPANNGCPVLDKDKDGIHDTEDKCPELPGGVKYGGCPVPDSDADGVNDEQDNCINEPGTTANNGCPEIKKDVIEKVTYAARKINFKQGSDILTTSSIRVLDEIILLLRETQLLNITIEGHSSLDGNAEANLELSQKRAERVKSYMVSKGIAAEKLTAIGYGVSMPLMPGKSTEANSLNRRVEVKPGH